METPGCRSSPRCAASLGLHVGFMGMLLLGQVMGNEVVPQPYLWNILFQSSHSGAYEHTLLAPPTSPVGKIADYPTSKQVYGSAQRQTPVATPDRN